MPLAVHLAPHPDDEMIGAPAHLLALRDAGWQVINVALSLGRPEAHERRREEVAECVRRAGLELIVPPTPFLISSNNDLVAAEDGMAAWLTALLGELQPDLVISPSPHDRHYGHEVVARAARRALEAQDDVPRWWQWGLWGDLPLPVTVCEFDQARLDEILHALAAHAGELERNDYRRLVSGRAEMNGCLAYERVFGFGRAGNPTALAEVCTDLTHRDAGWALGEPRVLDKDNILAPAPEQRISVDWWLDSPSVTQRLLGQA